MRRTALTVLLSLAALLGAPAARADDEAAATELFNAGRDLLKQGDYAAACPKLAESVRLKATVGALAKLAACEEHEKRLVSAYTRWQQALNVARATGDERAADVQAELARISAIVPKLRVTAAGALPADAVIHVDDTMLGAAGLGVALPVEPGSHTVRAEAAGKNTWTTTVQVGADGATTGVAIPVLEDAPVPTVTAIPIPLPTPAPTPIPTPTPPPSSAWPTIGLVMGVTGVAALIGGGVAGFLAIGQRNDAHCQGTTCPDASSAATLSGAQAAANWSTGLLVAGGLLAAGGVTLWLVARDHPDDAVRVSATLLPAGVMVGGDWR